MTKRKDHTQEVAAAKAGMSVRTARRATNATELPSQKPERQWRTRANPFADVWDSEVVPLLRSFPKLKAVTLLRKLQEDHSGRFPDGMRRTLERHVSRWRALEGPSKEVFFPQRYQPGVRGLSDFTHMEKLGVTIAGVAFGHMLYHFVLAFSRWEYASVVDSGESFQALAAGLQNALWQAGGCHQLPVKAVATWSCLVNNAYVSRFRLKTLAQAIDIRLRRTGLAEQFDLARAERIGDSDRILVNVESYVQRAIVFHAGLRAGNRRVWHRPHRAALAAMLTRV